MEKKFDGQLLVHVVYTVKPGCRDRFLREVAAADLGAQTRTEPGNSRYDWFLPVESPDQVFLLEIWKDGAAQQAHCQTPHYGVLQGLKEKYVLDVSIEKFTLTDDKA